MHKKFLAVFTKFQKLKVVNFACKNKHVSIIGMLTNLPHFNSAVILFLHFKILKVGGLSQQKCSANCGT